MDAARHAGSVAVVDAMATAPDKLIFQSDLLPKQTKSFALLRVLTGQRSGVDSDKNTLPNCLGKGRRSEMKTIQAADRNHTGDDV